MTVKAKPKPKAPVRTSKAAKPASKAAAKAPAKPAAKKKPEAKPAAKSAAKPAAKAASPKGKENELRVILEDLRRDTLKEIQEKVRSGTAGTSKEIGDMYDQASEERDRELDLLLGDRERGKLHQIDDAFTRLKEGTYGICEECGEPINPKRLRIVPFARTCVDCQTDKEHEERVNRDRDVETERVYSVTTGDAPASTDEED